MKKTVCFFLNDKKLGRYKCYCQNGYAICKPANRPIRIRKRRRSTRIKR